MPEKWVLDENHPIYGKVVMMETTQGKPYRWLKMKNGTVAMVPLSVLNDMDVDPDTEGPAFNRKR